MANKYYRFKQFTIFHDKCAMKVGTDGVLLGSWANIGNCKHVLDVGCGSGIVAMMLAQRSETKVDAVEIDTDAYHQASENIANCPWEKRISLFHQSFQEFSKSSITRYNHIVCNPPYFTNSLKTQNEQRNVARHNITLSQKELIECAAILLAEDGRLSVILPFSEGNNFIAEAMKSGLFCNAKTNVKTLPNQPVKRLLLEFSKIPSICTENTILIYTEAKVYSNDYIALTKDFYLAF